MADYLTFNAYIDFDNNADFMAANEDISSYLISFSVERVIDEDLTPGYLQIVLDNTDKRWIPQYTGGAYYPNLTMGRRVKLTATLVTEPNIDELDQCYIDHLYARIDTFEIDLFNGFITTIKPELTAEEPCNICTIEAYDFTRLLELRKFVTGTLLNKRSDEIVTLALNQLGVASPGYWIVGFGELGTDTVLGGAGAMWRDIDTGKADFAYVSFDDNSTVGIRDVTAAELGQFYVRADGWAAFENRHHRNSERENLFVFTDDHIAELMMVYDDEELWNHIEVIAHPRSIGTAGTVVWSAIGDGQDGTKLAAGESRDYNVSYTDPVTGRPCDIINAITPLEGTDWTANALADGTGADVTSFLDVTMATDANERTTFTAVNASGTALFITKLQLRATPLVAFDPVTMTAENADSIAGYLQRDHTIDIELFDNPIEAQNYADFLILEHKYPMTRIDELVLNTTSAEIAEQQIMRELSDRIEIDSARYYPDPNIFYANEFFITGIKMESEAQLENIRTEFQLSKAPEHYWLLGTDWLPKRAIGPWFPERPDPGEARLGY